MLVANSVNKQTMRKNLKKKDWNPGTFNSTQQDLSYEYQHDRIFKNVCVLVPWKKVASASEGLNERCTKEIHYKYNLSYLWNDIDIVCMGYGFILMYIFWWMIEEALLV